MKSLFRGRSSSFLVPPPGQLGFWVCILLALLPLPCPAYGARPLTLEDFSAIRSVSDVTLSRDGRWAAYVVEEIDTEEDQKIASLWRVPTAGGSPSQLTRGMDDDRRPRFAPDDRFLAFISDRDVEAFGIPEEISQRGQLFLLPLNGGAPFPITESPGGISDYAWAPDGSSLVIVSRDPRQHPRKAPDGRSLPIVLTRMEHKGGSQFRDEDRKEHLYLLDPGEAIASSGRRRSSPRALTTGDFDEDQPAWSPDGKLIAFTSNRTEEPERNRNTDLWTINIDTLEIRQLTTDPGADARAAWSPDGSHIAYVHTPAHPPQYALPRLMVMSATGGGGKDLSGHTDRGVSRIPNYGGFPLWSGDGKSIAVTMIENGRNPLYRFDLSGTRTLIHDGNVEQWTLAGDTVAAILTPADRPAEVFTLSLSEDSTTQELSHANQDLFRSLDIRAPEDTHWKSLDGTSVQGWLIKPPGFRKGVRYPLIVWIHGGPVWQWTDAFRFEPHYFAALGYLVLLPNPRGSIGFGEDFSYQLFADWGNKDFDDVMTGVDALVDTGLVDPEKLGVGGWSYGSVLTNYVITKTDRFAAAVSGAGHSDLISSFGTDGALLGWIEEFGLPWENRAEYSRMSSITQVDKVTTPTLFLYGERDFNCAPGQAEQMYVSLKVLGRETALILYPGEGHGFRKPSNQIDRARRYALWFEKYIRGKPVNPTYQSWPPPAAPAPAGLD